MGPAAVSAFGFMAATASVFTFELYGFGLYVVLPVVLGFSAVLLARPDNVLAAGAISLIPVVAVGSVFILAGLEGLICILMALFLWGPGAVAGGLGAYGVRAWVRRLGNQASVVGLLILTTPLFIGAESLLKPEVPLNEVSTSVVIDALPSRVWERVIAFEPLPEPSEWLFHVGIAYPTRAEIEGHGVGAVRRCVFSTGAFIEPITIWDEPRMLAFEVAENPPPMRELSFYDHVHAPHLHGFFVSQRGRFTLTDLGDGRTRLEGTTWYRNHMAPQWYWRLWTDGIIHAVHTRVLNHIKALAEEGGIS